MAEPSENINIFNGATASFLQALPSFAGASVLSMPVRPAAAGGATLFFVPPQQDGGHPCLPAFTEEAPLPPPLIKLPAREAALLLFHAPHHDHFIFNPPIPPGRSSLSPLSASRSDVSLLAGFLESGGAAPDDSAAAAQASAGRLHAAHYLYALAAARNPASRARFSLGPVLAELGLLQEAYDGLKAEQDPEALFTLAVIHRKTGNFQAAAGLLDSIPSGGPLDERIAVEKAWLDLETGRDDAAEKNFQRLSTAAFDKAEPLSGLGAALAKSAFRTKDKGKLSAAAAALRSALAMPSPISARLCFQLGNLYFRSGDMAQAENCYRRSADLAPAVQALGNLALTLLKTGKPDEAAAVTLKLALTDTESAARLAAQFPPGTSEKFFPAPAAAPEPEPQPAPAPASGTPPQAAPPPVEARPQSPAAAAAQAPRPEAGPPAMTTASLEPAPLSSDRTTAAAPATAKPAQAAPPQAAKPRPKIETLRDTMDAPAAPTEAESRKDAFISGAFRLASDLEDELGRKIYFNSDGLDEAEKRLRLTLIKAKANQQAKIDMVRDCAAFLCYFLQERQKGRLIKFPDFDPWGWPMIFEQPDLKVTTYPVQRVWRVLWNEEIPEPGWLGKYVLWLSERMKVRTPPPSGLEAAKKRIMSHAERLTDTATEHRRMMVLASSLPETSGIELGRSGLFKLEKAIQDNFKPDIPPTADGWKLLRCYGHILAETLAKDMKGLWYNTDGEDGNWAMVFPWKTIVFPLGKVYRSATDRSSLVEYYDRLLAERMRTQGGPTG